MAPEKIIVEPRSSAINQTMYFDEDISDGSDDCFSSNMGRPCYLETYSNTFDNQEDKYATLHSRTPNLSLRSKELLVDHKNSMLTLVTGGHIFYHRSMNLNMVYSPLILTDDERTFLALDISQPLPVNIQKQTYTQTTSKCSIQDVEK
ncbi:hypothetical protein HQQ94_09625 [Shewanella sp. VB17]|uniref:hypothetical protein n=1 Tax=Shewanella sp. VB17 TaxID=2739432 RepID=UPI0015643BE9|nr:hypothetical protein [Shewanella sp. VB17]NRD73500.1 hypothetical protein [Shewanella sp. VB17]